MEKKINKGSFYLYPGTIGLECFPLHLMINIVTLQICNMYNVTMKEIRAKGKKNTLPRHLICHLIHKISKHQVTYQRIGDEVNRDHAAVYHACQKIDNWMQTNSDFKQKIKDIENQIATSF